MPSEYEQRDKPMYRHTPETFLRLDAVEKTLSALNIRISWRFNLLSHDAFANLRMERWPALLAGQSFP